MKVLVTGAGGQLGRDVIDVLSGLKPLGGLAPGSSSSGAGSASIEVVGADRARLDVTERDAVGSVMEGLRPDIVIHTAAWTAVDDCEADPDRAFACNALATRHVAEAARRYGAHVVYISTDYVFDGSAARPYVEWDLPRPLSVYGRSKLGGEQELDPRATIIRTSWVSGAHGANMVGTVLRLASAGPGPLRFVDDQHGCPTFTADLAGMVARLAAERQPGVFHVTNQGVASWYEFARAVMEAAGHDPSRVEPITTAELIPPRPAPRPANSVLDNLALRRAGFPLLPEWRDALGRLVQVITTSGVR
jgi:dTDP-4-dehydrorhamnose reductase